ncbi:hypothetical protein [Polaribacter septentrionalilitoris]|uniref:hypothetical protein n=1 Tax=Polaribacter septentrionalilitoris TaxID=2494657 RepID=UPI0013572D7D|nr:hypothetical protein [Polaribacter septentrionalilitoris]
MKKLIEDGKTIDKVNVEIFYYKFLDEVVAEKNKSITDKQTTLYHFSSNMFLCSILLLVIQVLKCRLAFDDVISIVNLVIMIISAIGTLGLLYGKGKIRSRFKRHYTEFIDSQYYIDLKDKN